MIVLLGFRLQLSAIGQSGCIAVSCNGIPPLAPLRNGILPLAPPHNDPGSNADWTEPDGPCAR